MTSNSVIDLSHHNGTRLRFDKAKEDGIVGVIQKASQGEGYVDPTFKKNRTATLAAGLLFGAYHFGTGSNGVSQAEHFLETLGLDKEPDNKTVVVLDFEDNPTGSSMTLEEARAFVVHVHDKLGRWPGFYSGHTIKRALGTSVDPILKNCWFWLAQYGPTAVVPPCWTTWTLWQYTDGGVGPAPHSVNGIGACDREFYSGTNAQLKTWWGS
ncbi:MAG: glycoside hydrolase family 25 protein [Rhizomicrobium sp.]